MAVSLFIGCLSLAILHAVLVQNQAQLDKLILDNQTRQDELNRIRAEIAYLDSPEGVEDHAIETGLVLAAEVVTLIQISPGLLQPPSLDPFSLAGLPPVNSLGNLDETDTATSDPSATDPSATSDPSVAENAAD